MSYQRIDGTPMDPILAMGASGIITWINDHFVMKLPLVYRDPKATAGQAEEYEILAEMNLEALRHEQKVLRRLGNHPGLIEWSESSDDGGIRLKYMKNGDLARFIQSSSYSRSTMYQWILTIAQAIKYAHQRHVILGDIASRNVLLDEDLTARLCDFGSSAIIPFTENLRLAVDSGASIQTDIFQYGSLLFEIVSGRCYKYDLFDNGEVEYDSEKTEYEVIPHWPCEDELPATAHLPFGVIIQKCLKKCYGDMTEACEELQRHHAAWSCSAAPDIDSGALLPLIVPGVAEPSYKTEATRLPELDIGG